MAAGRTKGPLVARLSPNSQSQVQVEDGYLIALAKQGDPTSYDRLVRRYYGLREELFEVTVTTHPEGRYTYTMDMQRSLRSRI